jgi:hypothetical protein
MRRVIDDAHYEEVKKMVMDVIFKISAAKVSEYDYGIYRAQRDLIMKYILKKLSKVIKFGKDMNNTGIGNNACYELIYLGDSKEEQICGIIHLTDDMYGDIICWVTDYDEKRKSKERTIYGCKPIQ